jgi:hypothetical protein
VISLDSKEVELSYNGVLDVPQDLNPTGNAYYEPIIAENIQELRASTSAIHKQNMDFTGWFERRPVKVHNDTKVHERNLMSFQNALYSKEVSPTGENNSYNGSGFNYPEKFIELSNIGMNYSAPQSFDAKQILADLVSNTVRYTPEFNDEGTKCYSMEINALFESKTER